MTGMLLDFLLEFCEGLLNLNFTDPWKIREMEIYVHEVNGAKFFVTVQNSLALYIVFNVCIVLKWLCLQPLFQKYITYHAMNFIASE